MNAICFWKKWRFETEFETQRFGIRIHRNVNSEFWDIVNQFCQYSFEEIWSKSLQSDFWALTAFVKKAILRKNSNFERLKWNSNRWWWINFANIKLKKFGQNLFKVVFECSRFREKRDFGTEFELREIEIGLREKGHFETDFEPRGWNWNRIGGWWISFAIVDMWVIWSKALQSDLLNRLKRNSRIRLSYGKCAPAMVFHEWTLWVKVSSIDAFYYWHMLSPIV